MCIWVCECPTKHHHHQQEKSPKFWYQSTSPSQILPWSRWWRCLDGSVDATDCDIKRNTVDTVEWLWEMCPKTECCLTYLTAMYRRIRKNASVTCFRYSHKEGMSKTAINVLLRPFARYYYDGEWKIKKLPLHENAYKFRKKRVDKTFQKKKIGINNCILLKKFIQPRDWKNPSSPRDLKAESSLRKLHLT